MKTHDVIIGVDIGINGGIAFFDVQSRELLSLYSMPTEIVNEKRVINLKRLKYIMEIPKVHNELALVVMENVHAFPFQGAVSIGTLMLQRGIISGLSLGLGYDIEFVEPRTWQKAYGLIPPKSIKGKNVSSTKTLRKKWLKDSSIRLSHRQFPDWKYKIGKSDGMSDATLIGLYKLNSTN